MIIDTSAVLAILFDEDDAARFAGAIAGADRRAMSAANFLEAGIVIDNQLGPAAGRQLDALLARAQIEVAPVTREQAEIARQAYLDFSPVRSAPSFQTRVTMTLPTKSTTPNRWTAFRTA